MIGQETTSSGAFPSLCGVGTNILSTISEALSSDMHPIAPLVDQEESESSEDGDEHRTTRSGEMVVNDEVDLEEQRQELREQRHVDTGDSPIRRRPIRRKLSNNSKLQQLQQQQRRREEEEQQTQSPHDGDVSGRLPLSVQVVVLERLVQFWYGRNVNETAMSSSPTSAPRDGDGENDDISDTSNNSNPKGGKNRCTPLMEAAKYGDDVSVHLILVLQYYKLLSLKKQQQKKTKPTYTQHQDQQQQFDEQIQSILHQIRISLHLAIWEGHEHIVRLLLLVDGSTRTHHSYQQNHDNDVDNDTMIDRFYRDILNIHNTCDLLQFDMVAIAIVHCFYPIIHLLLGRIYSLKKRGNVGSNNTLSLLQQTDEFGRTMLHLALMSCGDITVVQKVLKCCPQLLHVVDNDTRTPLQYAIASQDKVKVRFLLDLGAKVNTPLLLSTTTTHATSETLSSSDDNSSYLSSPLHMASCYPIPSIVKSLLQCGADFRQRDMYGRTPFIVACSHGHVVVVQMFISKCCNKNKKAMMGIKPNKNSDSDDYTSTIFTDPLDKSSSTNGGFLDINDPDHHGQTPLHYAVMGSHIGATQLLLQHDANVNAQTYPSREDEQDGDVDSCLWTPLHIASFWGCIELIQLLYEHGAVLTMTNQAGDTPIDVAKKNDQLQAVNLLLELQEKQRVKEELFGLAHKKVEQQPEEEEPQRPKLDERTYDDDGRQKHEELMDVLSTIL